MSTKRYILTDMLLFLQLIWTQMATYMSFFSFMKIFYSSVGLFTGQTENRCPYFLKKNLIM